MDTQPYPANDPAKCPAVSQSYPTCIGDAQIQGELQRLITASGLPTAGAWSAPELGARAPIYFVVLPADVNVCQLIGNSCANNKICGYHSSFVDKSNQNVLYAAIPMRPLQDGSPVPNPKDVCQIDGTTAVQTPNNDFADTAINTISHEDSEAITDPLLTGWKNRSGNTEAGDNCNWTGPFNPAKGSNPDAYTPTLGGSAAAGTLFDQLINGHHYYLQSEWSNGSSHCEMRPSPGRITPRFKLAGGRHVTGAPLTFNASASTSTAVLSSATWDFGDGSKQAFRSGRTALKRVKHGYRKAGRYTVTLTLVDNRGNLTSIARRLTIRRR